LSGLKQRLIYRYLLYEFEQETHQDSDRWLEYTCSGILPVYIAAISFYIFFFGEKIGVYGTAIWMVLIIVSIAVDLFILQPTKILLKWIVIPSFAYEMIRKYYLHIRDQAKILLLRIRGSLNDDESLVQHLNPACRVARSSAQSFPSARLLVSLTDTDIPSTSQLNPSLVILPFIFVFRVFLTIVTIFPYPVQDCLFESIIISTFFAMIFLIVTYIKYSLYMIVVGVSLPIILFIREWYEARRRRENASQRLDDELDLSIESRSKNGRYDDESDFIDSPIRTKKNSSSSSPRKKSSFFRSPRRKYQAQKGDLDYDTSNHDSSDHGSNYDSNSFHIYETMDEFIYHENQSFVQPMRLGPKSMSKITMSPSKLSRKKSMKCHPIITEWNEEDEQPGNRQNTTHIPFTSKASVNGLSLDDIDSSLAGENYHDDDNWSSDEDGEFKPSKTSSLARTATFYDKMKKSFRHTNKVDPLFMSTVSPMNKDFSISIAPGSANSSVQSTPSKALMSPQQQNQAGVFTNLRNMVTNWFSKPKPKASPAGRRKRKPKMESRSPSLHLSYIDQVSDDYTSSSASPNRNPQSRLSSSPSHRSSFIRSPLRRMGSVMGLSMSNIIVEGDFEYQDVFQQEAPPLLSSPLSKGELNSYRRDFTRRMSMRNALTQDEEQEVSSATATSTSHELDDDIFKQIIPNLVPDDVSVSTSSQPKQRKTLSKINSSRALVAPEPVNLMSPTNQSFVIDVLHSSPQPPSKRLQEPTSTRSSMLKKPSSSKLYENPLKVATDAGLLPPTMPPAPPSTTSPYRPPRLQPLSTRRKPLTEEGVFASEFNPLSMRRTSSKRNMSFHSTEPSSTTPADAPAPSPSYQAFTIDIAGSSSPSPSLAPLKARPPLPTQAAAIEISIEESSPMKESSSSTFSYASRRVKGKEPPSSPAIRSVMAKETTHVDKSMIPPPLKRDSSRFQPVNNLDPALIVEDSFTQALPADSASFDHVHTETGSVISCTVNTTINLPSSPARMTRTLSQRLSSFRAEPTQSSTVSETKVSPSVVKEDRSNPHLATTQDFLNQDPTIYNLALLDNPNAMDEASAMRVKYRKPKRRSLLHGEHEVDDSLRSQLLAIYGSSADSTLNPDEDEQPAADSIGSSSPDTKLPFQRQKSMHRQSSFRMRDLPSLRDENTSDGLSYQQTFLASDELSRIEADLSGWNPSPTRAFPAKKVSLTINSSIPDHQQEDEEDDWEQYKASRVLYSPSKKRIPPPSSPSKESLPAKLRVSAALVAQMNPSSPMATSPSRSKPVISSIHIPGEEVGDGGWQPSQEMDEWSRFKPMSVRYQKKGAATPSTKSNQQQRFFPNESDP
jgi:hypothetical protein